MISRQEYTECRDRHAVVTCWETSPGGLAPGKLLPPSGGICLTIQDQVTISPDSSQTVSTGIGVQIPDQHVGFIVPMPSLIARGISIVEKTLDPGRTEEVKLTLLNRGKEQGDMSTLEVVAKLIVTPTCNS
ncbi:deoxyuridine 5'-triphosphate nucleotidohydrolase-like [Bombina bombina]|uniref:deoxyuridine 5'-triphosphate nucleotidohydrolase-like n=1 Tax=Bombina bombina TaxID=8345 RepID=UPI00235AF307|nr:deoxyuridine 5'-triphosphate nucleotidohydrolase-like [Bombina bombina]